MFQGGKLMDVWTQLSLTAAKTGAILSVLVAYMLLSIFKMHFKNLKLLYIFETGLKNL